MKKWKKKMRMIFEKMWTFFVRKCLNPRVWNCNLWHRLLTEFVTSRAGNVVYLKFSTGPKIFSPRYASLYLTQMRIAHNIAINCWMGPMSAQNVRPNETPEIFPFELHNPTLFLIINFDLVFHNLYPKITLVCFVSSKYFLSSRGSRSVSCKFWVSNW